MDSVLLGVCVHNLFLNEIIVECVSVVRRDDAGVGVATPV